MKKRFLKSMLLACMAIIMLFSCTIGVGAISMEGSSTVGGNPSATTNKAYAISSKKDLAGWRFAVVTTSGTINSIKDNQLAICVDIIVNDKESYVSNSHYMFSPQYPKIRFVQLYGDVTGQHNPAQTVARLDSSSVKTLVNNKTVLKESSMGFSAELPDEGDYNDLAAAMNVWQDNESDLGKVLNKFNGFERGVADLSTNHRVTVEPIYRFSIAGENGKGEWHLMTPTEMAWFSGACYGYNFNGWSGSKIDPDVYASNGDGTWAFIGNYTHRYWPASLYTENTRGLPWLSVSEFEATSAVDDARSPRVRVRSYDIIRKGYGVAILYTDTNGGSGTPDPGGNPNSAIDLSVEQIQYVTPEASTAGFYRYYTVYLNNPNYPGYKLECYNPTTDRYAFGGTAATGYPTFSYGMPVTVYVQFKNNGKNAISLDGYFTKLGGSQTIIPASPSSPSKYPKADNYTIQPGETKWFWVDQFDAMQLGESSYTAEVYANNKKTAEGESNTQNNLLTARYFVSGDLGVNVIQYKYKDPTSSKWVSQNVYFGGGTEPYLTAKKIGDGEWAEIEDLPRFPAGVTVSVWVQYRNNQNYTAKIDGYYALDDGTSTIVGAHPTNSSDYPSSNGYPLGGYNSKWFWAGSIATTSPGLHSVTTSVYYDGRTSSAGETSVDNNIMVSEYFVEGYDVEISDIYYKDENGNRYGVNTDTAELEFGKTYTIYYTITNNSTKNVIVNVYDNVDPTSEGALCVTHPSFAVDGGILLTPGQTRNVNAGKLTPAKQTIGEMDMDGSVFIGDSTSTTFTMNGMTLVEADTTNNAREETITIKFDVAITDIYFTTTDGTELKADSSGVITVPANVELIRYYVLKNNTNAPIDVNVYYEDTAIKHGPDNLVITLAAGEEKAVATGRLGYTISSTAESVTSTIVGRVYRAGQGIETDLYELTFDNNVYKVDVKAVKVPYLTAIAPNASYRVGTEVITSFYLHNPTSYAYTGVTTGKSLQVTFTVKDLDGTVLYTTTQNAIAPAKCEGTSYPSTYVSGKKGGAQLVFFKWTLPENYEKSMVVINAELNVPRLGLRTSNLINNRSVCSNEVMNTPDTQYEAAPPSNWQTLVNANAPFSSGNNSRSWYVYTYTGGRFVRNYYYYSASAKYVYMNPISATTEYNGSNFFMRSGYGVKLTAYGIDVSKNATASMYTDMQYAYATWQEFGYSTDEGKITTLEKVGSQWQLPEYLDYVNDNGTGKRIHFTPIWYPNRDYSAYVCFSDIWTPMGMITAARETNEIQIRDDMYEDWYIGHG